MNPMTRIPASTPAAGQRDILLSARALSKSYGGLRAVNNASLDLYPGEVVALVGDNGAGKSTFVKMLSGVIMPDAGTLALHGGEVRFTSPTQAREAGIETLHQSLALVDVFNVPENIFLGRELSTRRFGVVPMLDKAAMRSRTLDLLQRIGANLPSIDRPVRAMSGSQPGQKSADGVDEDLRALDAGRVTERSSASYVGAHRVASADGRSAYVSQCN